MDRRSSNDVANPLPPSAQLPRPSPEPSRQALGPSIEVLPGGWIRRAGYPLYRHIDEIPEATR